MPFNLPIALTWLRVAAIPLLVGIFYLPSSWLSIEEKIYLQLRYSYLRRLLIGWMDF